MRPQTLKHGASDPLAPDAKIGIKEKLSYAVGDTASVLYFHTFSQFLMIYYTDVFGITSAAVGTMFLISRLIDVATDPIMGAIGDATKTKYGKFRPWLLWGIVPYMVLGVLTMTVPDFSEGGKLIWAYVTYIGVMTIYTVVNIPYGALMGVMTSRSSERSILASFRFYGAYAAVFFVNLTMMYFVGFFGDGDDAVGFQRTMILYALMAGALFYVTFSGTRERVLPPKGQQASVGKDLAILVKTWPWLAICGIGIVTLIGVTTRNAAVMYFLKYYVNADAKLITIFLTAGTGATLLGVAFTGYFEKICGGKKAGYMVLSVASGLVSAAFYFVDAKDMVLLFTVHLLSSALMGPLMPFFWSMIADTADYAEWRYGRRFTGLIFSAGTTSQKTGWAVGGFLSGHFLAWYGYEANVEQAPDAIEGIKLLMSFIPSGIGILSAAMVLLYGINATLSKQIETELAARKVLEHEQG